MYGILNPDEEFEEAEAEGTASIGNKEAQNGGPEDIEALVQKEINSLKSSPKGKGRYFTRIRLNVECLLFSKTQPPIDPVAMAHRISADAKRDAEEAAMATGEAIESGLAAPVARARACRYLNRLTPITASGRATEKGVQDVAREVLPPWFAMAPRSAATATSRNGDQDDVAAPNVAPEKEEGPGKEKPTYTVSVLFLFFGFGFVSIAFVP